jgi:hypothetical protein
MGAVHTEQIAFTLSADAYQTRKRVHCRVGEHLNSTQSKSTQIKSNQTGVLAMADLCSFYVLYRTSIATLATSINIVDHQEYGNTNSNNNKRY